MKLLLLTNLSLYFILSNFVITFKINNENTSNEDVILYCPGSFNNSLIHEVRWFWNEKEFCRYLNKPIIFHHVGLKKFKKTDCNKNLIKLSQSQVGVYTCQVWIKGPSYNAVISGGNLSVIAYPRKNPVITGNQEKYKEGDYVNLNCTSPPSNPPAVIDWIVNGKSAESWAIHGYGTWLAAPSMWCSCMGLKLKANKRYFPEGWATITCSAKVATMPPWQVTITPSLTSKALTGIGIQKIRWNIINTLILLYKSIKS